MTNDIDPIRRHAAFDLKAWQFGTGDWFTVQLYALIAKADRGNREALREGFPVEVEIFEEWQNMPTSEDFYTKYGV